MKEKPQIFIGLDDVLVSNLIGKAERIVIYAGPAVSFEIAEAIVKKRKERPDSTVRVIVNADADSLRLGYGKFGGIKLLWNNQVDVRCSPGLRIGALVIDNRSWIFSPTPEIILDKPTKGTLNAITVNPSFTKWLIFSMAPKEGFVEMAREAIEAGIALDGSEQDSASEQRADDEVLDEQLLNEDEALDSTTLTETEGVEIELEPQIGTDAMTSDQLAEMENDIKERPPKQFDQAREILVYNGYLQFVDLKFSGGRLSARTIRLPDHLLSIVKNPDTRLEIIATCKVFEDANSICPEIQMFEKRVNEIRRQFTRPLGGELGSVILAKDRTEFDAEIVRLRGDLEDLSESVKAILNGAIRESRNRLINVLSPLLLNNPPNWLKIRLEQKCDRHGFVVDLLKRMFDELAPSADELIERMEVRCSFKDVTWEMLNDEEFGKAIKKRFPNEAFTELYGKRNAIGEKEPSQMRLFNDEDWPDEIDNEPKGF